MTNNRTNGFLVIGATGLLGQALLAVGRDKGVAMTGAARTGAEHWCDVTDAAATEALIRRLRPRAVINAAAVTDLTACEQDPAHAYLVNARAVGVLVEACRVADCGLIHISTDHFFTGDGFALHDERAPVRLVNEYARSKFAGESLALTLPGALVLRTNITGFRGWPGRPTFAEWAFQVVEQDAEVTLFEDFVTSTIDARSLARAVLTLAECGTNGLLNLASREAASKRRFIETLARRLGRPLNHCRLGRVGALSPRRAESLALDVRAAETRLGAPLPTLDDVIDSLVSEYQVRCATRPAS